MAHADTPVWITLGFASGLTIFLLGISILSDHLKAAVGERMKRLIARSTANRVLAVTTGIVVTVALGSSSAALIIVVGLVHARALTFPQALGIVLGANIGTTLKSQLLALDVTEYAAALLLPGLLLHWAGRSPVQRTIGGAVLGLGLVFFALAYMETVARPLRDSAAFRGLMLSISHPLLGVLTGAAATAVIQSSSAMMAILIALCGQGAVPLDTAVAIMLGAEIGTCLDVLVASAGRSREAVRVGVFQLGFNVATVALGLLLLTPLCEAATGLAGHDVKRQLATAHVLFNVGGVVLVLGVTRTAGKVVERLIPEPEAGPPLTDAGGEKAPSHIE